MRKLKPLIAGLFNPQSRPFRLAVSIGREGDTLIYLEHVREPILVREGQPVEIEISDASPVGGCFFSIGVEAD